MWFSQKVRLNALLELLTPIAKAFSTDIGCEVFTYSPKGLDQPPAITS